MSHELSPRGDRVGWRDVAFAVGVCTTDLVAFSSFTRGGVAPHVLAYAYVGFAALTWRRHAPRTVFAIMMVHAIAPALVVEGYVYNPLLGPAAALFAVADRDTWRAARVFAALSLIFSASTAFDGWTDADPGFKLHAAIVSFVLPTLVNALCWSLGRWSTAHRALLAGAEHERQLTAREAVTDERVRIARDLHDVVSHTVSVMTLQAAGARAVLTAGDSARAAGALTDIETAGSHAMVELRRMLDVLRSPDTDGADDGPGAGATSVSRPGLHQLHELVTGVRAAGLPVRVAVSGTPRTLPDTSDVTAYRVIQEALTNVLRHAGTGTPTRLELDWTSQALTVDVVNDGPGNTARPDVTHMSRTAHGYGLLGLRERIDATGARLVTTAENDGGFRVQAVIPMTGPSHPERDAAAPWDASRTAGH